MAAIIAIGQTKEKPTVPTLTLPLDALSGDGGVEPEVGDEVEHSFKGKVTKISEETATIRVSALDGQPVEGSPEEESEESPEEEAGEEEEEGNSGSKNPGNPGPLGAGNPLAAALAPARKRSRAQTAAIGAALRKKARGQAMPLM